MTLLPPQSPPTSPIQPQPSPAYGAGSAAVPNSMAAPAGGGFDIWGPLQRRKYLIALFVILGAVGGYLYYINCPKTYSSSTRLMVTTQAPPSTFDGELRLAKESLDKHASLVSSELILDDAADKGKFDRLDIFKDTSYPVLQLRTMLRVVPETKETFSIVCTGSNPDDLPLILNQIVGSYERTVKKDSLAIGQKMVDLIQRLANKLNEEKQDAFNERDSLWQQLNIQNTDNEGFAINPHNRPLGILQNQADELQLQLTEIQDRARLLAKNLELDENTEDLDPVKIGIAAIEARDYLKLVQKPYKDEAYAGSAVVRNLAPELQQIQTLRTQIWGVRTSIEQRLFERSGYSTKLGSGNPKIKAIDDQIARDENRVRELEAQLKKLEDFVDLETKNSEQEANKPEKVARMDLETFRRLEERDWVRKYQLRLQQEQEQLATKLKRVNEQIEVVSKKARAAAAKIVRLNRLQSEIKQKSDAITAMTDKLAEIDILNNNYTMTNIKVLDKPKRGTKVAPSLPKSLALGSMLAFLMGLGLAILVDQSELAFRNPSEIFERLQVPVVGKIPRINTRQIEPEQGHASLVAAHKPAATASESFRDVRTALFFRANMDDVKTILFTSPSPGDGKSTTVCNLAISIAQAGKKVILVDADFRRPRVHQYFGQELNPGLLDVLNGEMSLKEAIQKAEIQENLFLLPSGGRPRNPGELVTSEAFHNLIDALRDKFDYVLIDSPPVLPVSDPATIASLVDGVYLVTRIRKGVKLTAQKAKETLDRVGANWLGVIVNGLDENPHYSEYGYQYGSYSYYGGIYGRYYDSNNRTYRDKLGG